MIILKDLFDLLATGELSNLKLSQNLDGTLSEEEYGKVINHINIGSVELHKRFNLSQREIILHVCPTQNEYHLKSNRIALLQNMNTRTYLEDRGNNDREINLIEVLNVFDESQTPLKMNDRHAIPYILQQAPDVLKITKLFTPRIFHISYQAYPSKIIINDDFNPESYEYDIPQSIIEPLLYYVAARVYKPMGSNDSTANSDKAAAYQQQYELACQKIALFGLDAQHNDDENTFERDGWA